MRDDSVYLRHILEAISRIERHVSGGRDAFFASDVLQDATMRNLQTLSEATQRLSEAAKATQPQIPWPQVAAFRNVLVHFYLDLDHGRTYDAIANDLGDLREFMVAMAALLVE